MPTLNDLQTVALRGNLVGAYDPKYWVAGLADPVSQTELLTYILDNLGGGTPGGENDVTEAAGDPSGAPGAGEPAIYQNTTTGVIFVWDGSQWNEVIGSGDDDITEGTGVPSGAPGAGEPAVYQNTVNGNLYIWNGTNWVLLGGGENDITEGAGTPSGAPGAGEPQVYQDTTNGNVYTWDGSQWNIMAVVASNGLTKTGADIELGGTLEKTTDVEVSSFTLRFGRLVGSLLAYLRIVPGTGTLNLFARDTSTSTEGELLVQPGFVQIECDNATQAGQIGVTPTSITAVVNASSVVQNRLLIDDEKVEVRTEELRLQTPDSTSSSAGYVLTLLDPTTGESDFRPAPSTPSPLPVYDSIALAIADGLNTGDQFKLSQSNTEGGVAGTIIELL
jgi:hypothetical protein